jgi:hypothetical protein
MMQDQNPFVHSVRVFEFALVLPAEDIGRRTSVISRPVVVPNTAVGPPLIRPANLDY